MIQINPNRNIENNFPDSSVKTATDKFDTLDGGLVNSLTVEMTPVQDLHGYDKPWAGGAGKNKLPYLTSGINQNITYTVASDGKIAVSGTSTGYSEISATLSLAAGTYTVSGALSSSTSGKGDIYVQNIDASPAVTIARDYQGSTQQTFTLSATTNIKVCIRATNVSGDAVSGTYEPMIRLASISDDSYEPYSNICPISGHTEAKAQINNTVYTTSLGGTEYGGELDMVSGEGDNGWSSKLTPTSVASVGTYNDLVYWQVVGGLSSVNGANAISDQFEQTSEYKRGVCYITSAGSQLIVVPADQTLNTKALADAWMAANTPEFVYKLATPTTLTLTGQSITAEVGENNVSAPLDGQSIEEVKYKEMFSWADVVAYVQSQVNP